MPYDIHQTYKNLCAFGLTRSQYDFSRNWLGQCQTYYGAIKSTNDQPCIEALTALRHSLEAMYGTMADDNHTVGHPRTIMQLVWFKMEADKIDAHLSQRVITKISSRSNASRVAH